MLEPLAGKLARAVLRGGDYGDVCLLTRLSDAWSVAYLSAEWPLAKVSIQALSCRSDLIASKLYYPAF